MNENSDICYSKPFANAEENILPRGSLDQSFYGTDWPELRGQKKQTRWLGNASFKIAARLVNRPALC